MEKYRAKQELELAKAGTTLRTYTNIAVLFSMHFFRPSDGYRSHATRPVSMASAVCRQLPLPGAIRAIMATEYRQRLPYSLYRAESCAQRPQLHGEGDNGLGDDEDNECPKRTTKISLRCELILCLCFLL